MNEIKENKISNSKLYLLMLMMLISGTANTLQTKAQDNIDIGNGNKFTHPYVQCAVMFIGELLCLPIYFILIYQHKR